MNTTAFTANPYVDDYGNRVNDLYPFTVYVVHNDFRGYPRKRVWCGSSDRTSAELHSIAAIHHYNREGLTDRMIGAVVLNTHSGEHISHKYLSEVI